MSLRNLGAVAAGINQGIDLAQRDQLLDEQRRTREQNEAFQQEQRAQWRIQNQRANEAADRAEQLRRSDAEIKPIGSDVTTTTDLRDTVMPGAKQITVDDEGGPSAAALPAPQTTTRKFTEADAARAMAKNRQAVGDAAGALALNQQAERLSMQQARAAFARLDASSAGMPLQDYVTALAEIGRSDESPIDFRPTKINPDGTVGVTVFNRHTGYEMPLTIKDAAHARELAQAHFNPEGYEAWRLKQAEYAARAAEKLTENPYITVPGGYVERKTGKFHRTMFGSGEVVGRTADGEPIYGTGKGSKGGDGKEPANFNPGANFDWKKAQEQATNFVDKVLDPDGKFTPERRAQEIDARIGAQYQAHDQRERTNYFINESEGILRAVSSNPKRYADQYEKVRAAGGDAVIAELARRGINPPEPFVTPTLIKPAGLRAGR